MKEKDYIKEYNDFWKNIVENKDGTLNKEQIMKELSDYSMVMDNCARAFVLMTNGNISKQNTMFFEVESIFNEKYIDMESYEEIEKQNTELQEQLDKIKDKILCWGEAINPTLQKDILSILEEKKD